ncbi:MAG: iron-sulfur cluster assembly accessory protein [Gammaproteobacteria bacterium]|nr:iron-sulfur cluster assembly accessory protein [Gammaproteobacteria bacterium]
MHFDTRIQDQVRVSAEAEKQLSQLVAAEDDVTGVRIFIHGGGCGGMNYGVTFVDKPNTTDCILEQGDLKLYVDPVALGFLDGLEVDFQSQGLNSSLVFRNAFQSVGGAGVCGGCGAAGGGGGGCA